MTDAFILIDESPSSEYDGLVPIIYDLLDPHETVPPEFNAVKITIDGRADGNLNWKESRLACINAIGRGLKILWNLDLGLPDRLHAPLEDQTQFLALGLSLEHFRDTLWKEFHTHSLGLCLYQGCANGHDRDSIAEYLSLLSQKLPDAIPLFVMLDTSTIRERILLFELIHKDVFHRFQRFVTDGILPARCITGKQLGSISRKPIHFMNEDISLGICLPTESPYEFHDFEKALNQIIERKMHFRFIPENSLTTEWDGLDHLLVLSKGVSIQGLRRLKGFCAAGGDVWTIGDALGLPSEKPF